MAENQDTPAAELARILHRIARAQSSIALVSRAVRGIGSEQGDECADVLDQAGEVIDDALTSLEGLEGALS
jgi:hypothetical protein